METTRKHIIVPTVLVEQVEKYQKQQGITTWTTAMLELLRKGLEVSK